MNISSWDFLLKEDSHRYDLNNILSIQRGNYELNEDCLSGIQPGQAQPHKQEALFSNQLSKF